MCEIPRDSVIDTVLYSGFVVHPAVCTSQAGEVLNATPIPVRTPFEQTRFSSARKKLLREAPDAVLLWDILEVFE